MFEEIFYLSAHHTYKHQTSYNTINMYVYVRNNLYDKCKITLTINQEHVWLDHSALDFKHNFPAL